MLKAYSIRDRVIDKKINESQARNLEIIVTRVLGADEQGKPGEIKLYKTDRNIENHKLHWFAKEILNQPPIAQKMEAFSDRLAEDLLEAEMNEDQSTRNKNILEGVLIVKISWERLILLKLEDIEAIDPITFEIKSSIGLDRAYLKAAIFSGDESSIRVIDRQRQVANFWSSKFLKLVPVRTDVDNTKAIADAINNQQLLNDDTFTAEEKETATLVLAEHLTKESHFDLQEVSDLLKAKFPDKLLELSSLFQANVLQTIDEQFEISIDTINAAFRKKIRLNRYITIVMDNFYMAKDSLLFDEKQFLSNNVLEIVVDDSCRDNVLASLKIAEKPVFLQ